MTGAFPAEDSSENPRFAPVILVPVTLERPRERHGL